MRKKLAIARQLRISRKNFSNNLEHKKMCSICYRTYVIECIIKGNANFKISFGGKYIQSLPERISDWYEYIRIRTINIIYRSLCNIFHRYENIYLAENCKPIHLKVSEKPNEMILYDFLEKNGFEITDEYLYDAATVYDVVQN